MTSPISLDACIAIAREAVAEGEPGAQAILDELEARKREEGESE